MLKKRIIICLDVKDGRTTKGVKFQNNIDIGDPVEMAAEYYRQGVDELVFYDIIASARGRGPILDLISRVAKQVFIPFCVGGGIGTIEDIRSTILAGAEKFRSTVRLSEIPVSSQRAPASLEARVLFLEWMYAVTRLNQAVLELQ